MKECLQNDPPNSPWHCLDLATQAELGIPTPPKNWWQLLEAIETLPSHVGRPDALEGLARIGVIRQAHPAALFVPGPNPARMLAVPASLKTVVQTFEHGTWTLLAWTDSEAPPMDSYPDAPTAKVYWPRDQLPEKTGVSAAICAALVTRHRLACRAIDSELWVGGGPIDWLAPPLVTYSVPNAPQEQER